MFGLSYLETYTYTCLPGYSTTDCLSAICLPDGTLSLPQPPECTGKYVTRRRCSICDFIIKIIYYY